MYKTDEDGNKYCVTERWIDAWGDERKSYVPGWCVCEAREYENGVVRIYRNHPHYVGDATKKEMSHMLNIYMIASRALGLRRA